MKSAIHLWYYFDNLAVKGRIFCYVTIPDNIMYIKNVEDFFLRSEEEERQTIMPGCGKMFYCTKHFVKSLTAHLNEDGGNQIIDENTTVLSDKQTEQEENGNVERNEEVVGDEQVAVDLTKETDHNTIIQKEKPVKDGEELSNVVMRTVSRTQRNKLCDDSLTDYSSENNCSTIYIPQIAEDPKYLTSVDHLSFGDFSRGLNVELEDSVSLNGSHACFAVGEIGLQKQQRRQGLTGLCNSSFTDYSSSSEQCEINSSLKSDESCDSHDLLIANVEAYEAILECMDKELKCSESFSYTGSNIFLDDETFTKQKFSTVYKWVKQINKSFLFDTVESFVEPSYDLIEEECDLDGEDDKVFEKQQKSLDVLEWVETINNVDQFDPIESFVEYVRKDKDIDKEVESKKSKEKSRIRRCFSWMRKKVLCFA